MRILVCTNVYPPRFVGGAELVAHDQAKALLALGHDVRVFAADLNGPSKRYERVDDLFDGVKVARVGTAPIDYSPEYLNFLHSEIEHHFQDLLATFQPDIVHCHNLIGLSAKLPILAKEFGAATVCTLHDLWGFCLNNTAIRTDGTPCHNIAHCHECLPRIHEGVGLDIPLRFRKDFIHLALEHIDAFIAPSRFVADRYNSAGIGTNRMHVLPNGINLKQFNPERGAPSAKTRIAFVGHLGAHKGVKTLLVAMARLKHRNDVVLSIIGQGPDETQFQNMSRALGIASNVHFLGRVAHQDMRAIYAETDILVLPSLWDENQPVSIMEAMASRIPVVASNKGGIPELIEDGITGFLFPAGDDKILAEVLEKLIASPDLRRTIGLGALSRLAELDVIDQAARQIELYRKIARAPIPIPCRQLVTAVIGYVLLGVTQGDLATLQQKHRGTRYFIPVDWMTDGMIADCTELALFARRSLRASRRRSRWFIPLIRRPRWLSAAVVRTLQRVASSRFPLPKAQPIKKV